MNIIITSIGLIYGDDSQIQQVNVNFRGSDYEVSINGFVPLTFEEYVANINLEKLVTLVKSKLIDKIQAEPTTEEPVE